ncbi:MAG: M28 family peptidase, partial [Bacteroidia bacterium]
MKKILFLLVLVPVLSWSQSKRKKRIAEEKANAVLVASLKSHVQYLADDQLEGRLTGSKGEELAMQYLVQQYQQMGIEAKGTNGYVQEFEIKEGKQVDAATRLVVEDQTLTIRKDYFPLPYSANKSAQGKPAIALTEKGQPWFFDLQDVLEDNQNNPHFDIENTIKQQAAHAVSKGATALFVYNSSNRVDNIQFNKNDTSALLSIPVIYITKEGIKKHFADESASYAISVNVSLSEKKRKARNVIAFLNNNAANTVIIGAHYDHLGYGEDKSALDTFHAVHNGADDNASGTAALLELARMLKVKAPTNNNYLFIHFSGEELGLLGSKYWLENPTVKIT